VPSRAASLALVEASPPKCSLTKPRQQCLGEAQFLRQTRGSIAKAGNSVTLLDEIDDLGERKAYEALFQKHNAQQRRKTALAFLGKYPQSWFLSQAYEIAAKASIDLGDTKSAVEFGRESLKLLPENPLLLVPIADAEKQVDNLAGATQDARTALNCLDRFLPPAVFSEKNGTRWKGSCAPRVTTY
jgi:tetratricopeptide (TPR) repeat protein